jgi:excisionase family DNA binding protein
MPRPYALAHGSWAQATGWPTWPWTACAVSANGHPEDGATSPSAPARPLKVGPLDAVADDERGRLFDALLEEFAERVAEKLARKIASARGDAGPGSGALEANLDVKQAAQVLGISPRSLYPLAGKGDVPSIKVGGRRLFRPTELKAYLEKQAAAAKETAAGDSMLVRRISRLIR